MTEQATRSLNRIIDVNYYPAETARRSNMRHRPIGIGVQGLADTFILLGMAFDSPEAQQLNKDIFETIYYAALRTSCQLAKEEGPYETYAGCPVSKVGAMHPLRYLRKDSATVTAFSNNMQAVEIPDVKSRPLMPCSSNTRANCLSPACQWVEHVSCSRCPCLTRISRLVCRIGRHPARHVGRIPVRPLGLGGPPATDCGARRAQLAAVRTHAHGLDQPDPGEQRM